MSNEIAVVPFEQQLTLARAFAQSGLFGVKTQEQALALMALCEAEGLHPAVAVRDYHIIQGKPALKADAMLARFQKAGGRVQWTAMTDTKVAAIFTHPQGGDVEIEWTKEMVVRAQIKNDMHQKYPRQMLRSRVISEGIRTVFPGIVSGVYSEAEAQDLPPVRESRQRVKEMGNIEQAPDKKAMLKKIAKASTLEDLESLRPEMRLFDGDDKAEVMGKAKERAEAIRSAAEPEPAAEQNGGDLV